MKTQFGISSSPQAPPKSAVQTAIEAAQMQLVYGPASGGIQHDGDPVPLSLTELETLWHLLSRFYHTETDAPDCALDVRRAVAAAKVRMRESGALPGDRMPPETTPQEALDLLAAQPFTNPARSARYDTVGSHRYGWQETSQDGSPPQSGTGTLEDMDRISALEQVNRWNRAQEGHSYILRTYWLLDPQ